MFAGSRSLGRLVPGVLLLSVGIVCLALVGFYLIKDLSIWVLGRTTTAEVVDSWYEETSGNDEGGLTYEFYIRYQFAIPNGQILTRDSRVAPIEWSAYAEGNSVRVRYFSLLPAHNRLDDSRFIPILALTYLPLIALSWIGLSLGGHLAKPASRGKRVPSIREVLGRGVENTAAQTPGRPS